MHNNREIAFTGCPLNSVGLKPYAIQRLSGHRTRLPKSLRLGKSYDALLQSPEKSWFSSGDCGYFFEGSYVHFLNISAQKNSTMTALFESTGPVSSSPNNSLTHNP